MFLLVSTSKLTRESPITDEQKEIKKVARIQSIIVLKRNAMVILTIATNFNLVLVELNLRNNYLLVTEILT